MARRKRLPATTTTTTANEPVHLIDCNNGWSKAGYRFSAILLPFSCAWFFSHVEYVIGLLIVLILCMSNRMQLTKNVIVMPAWDFEGFPLTALKTISLEIDPQTKVPEYLAFAFAPPTLDKPADAAASNSPRSIETAESADRATPAAPPANVSDTGLRIKRIHVSRMLGAKSLRLLKLLDQYAPHCQITPDARRFLLGVKIPRKLGKKSEIELPYHALEKVKNFVELIKSYELYFWRVWSIILALPLACLIIYFWSSSQAWADSLWKFLTTEFGPGVGMGTMALGFITYQYFTLTSHPITVYLGSILSSALMLQFFGVLWQPNRILLTEQSMDLAKEFQGMALYRQSYPWDSFVRVALMKPKGTTVPEQWWIALHTKEDEVIPLMLSAIKGDNDRMAFLNAIEKWAPHLTRDYELIEALKPSQKQSYTELWLQSLATPPKRERLTPLAPGLVLKSGEYLITDQLGTGGQGIAYLGARSSDSELIVIKEFVLPVFVEKVARRKSLAKFEQEAQLLQKLEHEQVVKLLDYFIEDHRAYLVLEHIKGRSLRRIVNDTGSMSNATVAALAEQMCEILKYLHNLEPPLVHRDFTPDNLILGDDGVLKLIDFNVAYRKKAQTIATVVGKHAYLPPEQFRGKPVPQSDIYAMGACLHFLLTGRDPEPVTVAQPLILCDSVDPFLDEVVQRCTALETSQRFASAEDLLQELRFIRAHTGWAECDLVLEVKKGEEVPVVQETSTG